jgi:hypothetical protein
VSPRPKKSPKNGGSRGLKSVSKRPPRIERFSDLRFRPSDPQASVILRPQAEESRTIGSFAWRFFVATVLTLSPDFIGEEYKGVKLPCQGFGGVPQTQKVPQEWGI